MKTSRGMIPRIGLVVGLRLPAVHARARPAKFRGRECDRRGGVVLCIRWAGG
jgi:hypothetical protein